MTTSRVASRIGAACACLLIVASVTGFRARTEEVHADGTVTVNVGTSTGSTISDEAVGLNTAVWDGHLLDPAIAALVRQSGARILRFPGGSTADAYHWQTNSLSSGQSGYVNPANSFDNFIQRLVVPSGATPMITVNYGSNAAGTGGGDPSEAADWVRYANITKREGIKYWEIGNEVYGNGYYGGKWETDLHSDHSPTAYATNALEFIHAMKAVDPSIKIGIVLCAPGSWPDGAPPEDWNSTVLRIAGKAADFAVVHWYPQSPGQEYDSKLLQSAGAIPTIVSRLRSEIDQYTGSRAESIRIMVTETNSVSYNPGKQTTGPVNALFLLQDYLTWLQAGVQNVTWWDLHNGGEAGNNNSSDLVGQSTVGDYGILSSGSSGEDAPNSPYPAFGALQLLAQSAVPGASFLTASSSMPNVQAFAVHRPDGRIAVTLINSSSSDAYTVNVHLGSTVGDVQVASLTQSTDRASTTSNITTQDGSSRYTLAPYSAAVLVSSTSAAGTTGTTTTASHATAVPVPTKSTGSASSTVASSTVSPGRAAAKVKKTAHVPVKTSYRRPLPLSNFDIGADGWKSNGGVTAVTSSDWVDTRASSMKSLWIQYQIQSAEFEVRVYKRLDHRFTHRHTLSVSVYAKQPTVPGVRVNVRFLARGFTGKLYTSRYHTVPLNTRTRIYWTPHHIPQARIKTLYIAWRYSEPATGAGNEIWVDDVRAT